MITVNSNFFWYMIIFTIILIILNVKIIFYNIDLREKLKTNDIDSRENNETKCFICKKTANEIYAENRYHVLCSEECLKKYKKRGFKID